MRRIRRKSEAETPSLKSFTGIGPDIASASIPDTLAKLRVKEPLFA